MASKSEDRIEQDAAAILVPRVSHVVYEVLAREELVEWVNPAKVEIE